MSDHWNAEKYRLKAKQWQEKADALSGGKERDVYVLIAEGYAGLALLIEERAANVPAALDYSAPIASARDARVRAPA